MKKTTKIIATTVLLCVLFVGKVGAVAKTWVGTTTSWNTAGNWAPSGVPGPADDVTFGVANPCNIDATVSVLSITMTAGTVTQNGFSITIGTGGFNMSGGTFNGGTKFIIDNAGFAVSGAATVFTSTTDTLFENGTTFSIANTSNFVPNGGKVVLNPPNAAGTMVTGTINFNKLDFRATAAVGPVVFALSSLTVADSLLISGTQTFVLNTGTVNAKKNLRNTNTGIFVYPTTNGGNATIIFNGSGVQQLIGPPNQGANRYGVLPSVTINTSGTFKIVDTSTVAGDWIYQSGTMSCPGMICFVNNTVGIHYIKGTHTLSHCQFDGTFRTLDTLAGRTNLIIDSTMAVGPHASVWYNDTIFMIAQSTITTTGSSGGGGDRLCLIDIKGTGTQKIIGNASLDAVCLCNVQIDKAPGDNLILTTTNPVNGGSDYIGVWGSWRYVSGTISGNGKVDFMAGAGGPQNTQYIYGTHTLPNVIFSASAVQTYNKAIHNTDILTVSGNTFTYGAGALQIDSGQVNMNGNFVVRNTGGGTGGNSTFNFVGTADQYFNCDAVTVTPSPPIGFGSPTLLGVGKLPNIAITKTGGTLFMNDSVTVNGNWDYYSGTVDATTLTSVRNFTGAGFHINGNAGVNTMGFDTLILGDANTRTVTGDFNVAHLLDLRTGQLTLNSHRVKVQNSWTGAVARTTGIIKSETNSTAGYGILDWQIGTATAGSVYLYPFGVDYLQYIPFTYTVTTPGSTAAGSMAISTYPTNWTLSPNNRPLPTGIGNINSPTSGIDNSPKALDRYWITAPTNYGTPPVATLQVTYRDSEWQYLTNSLVETQMQFSNWNTGTSSWTVPNNTTVLNTVANTATIPNQSSSNYTAYILTDTARAHFKIASSDTFVCAGQYVTFYDLHAVAPPSNYSWSFPGGTPSTSSGAFDSTPVIKYNTPGVYDVSVIGTYPGGTIADTFHSFITVTAGPTIVVDSTSPTCNGSCNGRVKLTISTPPTHTITWYQQPNNTNGIAFIDSITLKCAGTYVARIKQTPGCTMRDTFTLVDPPAITAAVTADSNLRCNAVCKGYITVVASGGIPPLSHNWSNGQHAATDSNLCAAVGPSGTIYADTVKDSHGCKLVVKDTLTQPAAISVSITAHTNPSCSGLCTGTATSTASGGTGTLSPVWTPNGQTVANPTNLCAGLDSVKYTDTNGCVGSANITLINPASIVGTVTAFTNVTCFGTCNGTATVTITGGSSPFTHHWNSGQTTAAITGLCPGFYVDTVKDVNGCFDTASVTITQPASALDANVTAFSNITCFGAANGSATVTATGGTGAYTHKWSPGGQTTATISPLTPGYYVDTVKDANGCKDTAGVLITQPAQLVGTVTAFTNVTCFGACDGTASVTVTGGTGTVTHHWSPGGQTTPSISALCPGTYVDTVRDANNCTDTARVVITQPVSGVTGTISGHVNVSCLGSCNGSTTVNPSGGTGPYTHHWNTSATTATISNLCAGPYADTVRDANGCSTIIRDTITSPAQLVVTLVSQTNLSCSGTCNGKIKDAVSGGSPPYVHHWSTGVTGAVDSIVNLCAGAYLDSVSDAHGCYVIFRDTITAPTSLGVTITSQINDSCFGQCNGSATATATGGSGSYLHHWSTGATATTPVSTITGLCQGTYTDTVRDANATTCAVTVQVTITQPVVLSATISSQTNVSCFNFCDGKARVAPAGGTGPYRHHWSTGPTTDSVTALCAGVYTDTVRDNNNCSTVVTVTITQPASMGHTLTVLNQVTCFGACDGRVVEVITGGASPYTYTWSPVLTNTPSASTASDTAKNICPGGYSVLVHDANGCTVTDNTTITQPTALAATITNHVNVSCNGVCDGQITVTPTVGTGTAGYTHHWSPGGQTTGAITALCAGIYVDTVKDANGCTIIVRDTITQPTALTSSITSASNITCNGLCNGRAKVTPVGGTPNYTYLWNTTPPQTTDSATNLCVGTWRVTITDAHNCTKVDSVTITQPALLVATVTTFNNVTCFGANDGAATVTVTGGTGTYSHHWSNNQTGPNLTSVAAGTYVDTVRDLNGCIDTASVTITSPTQLTATTSNTSISCGSSCDGKAKVIPAGGTPPYTHSWSAPGGHTDSLVNLCAGVYVDTLKDFNGCTLLVRDTITAPPLLSDSSRQTNISCHGACDGKARVYPYGGNPGTNPPYTFAWNTGPTIDSISGLCPGTYKVTITDSRGCTKVDSVTITEPPVLVITSMVGINATCNLLCNGQAWAVVSGGTPAYTYHWDNGGTTDTITNLCAGHYHLTVTDAHGCIAIDSITITEPAPITVHVDTVINVSCHGVCDGSAQITVSGGTGPYTYAWSTVPPQTTNHPINLCAGTYTVTITDSHGCSSTSSITVTEPATLQGSVTATVNVSCYGVCDGSIIATATGGTSPYTFLWNTTPPQSAGPQLSDTITGLCAGTYRVTITDAHNCTVVVSDTIVQPPLLSIGQTTITNVTCNGLCNGGATVVPAGGNPPYTHHWSNITNLTSISNACAGTYYDTVIDSRNCSVIDTIVITQPTPLVDTMRNIVNVSCYNLCNGRATANPSGGTAGYTYVWSNGQTGVTDTNLCVGTYRVTITDAHGCVIVDSVIITQPTQLTATITSSTNLLCNGVCTGQAVVVAAGGTPFTVGPAYHYSWNAPGVPQTRDTAINLCAGVDSVRVTDANGCVAVNFVTITEPPVLRDSFTLHTDVSCFGLCDGKVRVVGLGGTPSYSYQWASGPTTDSLTQLCVGNYVVTVTDNNNCTKRDSITITQPTLLTANINSFTNASCNGVCDGKAKVTAAGGTTSYTYSWNTVPAQTTDSVGNLCAGTYIVSVTDAHGCMAMDTVTITEPPVLHDSITAFSNLKCTGVCIGTATDSAWGGTSGYFYQWSTTPPQTARTAVGLCAGTYTVTTTDSHGCSTIASVTITEPALLVSRIDSFSNDSCNGQCNGFARTLTTGGVLPYSYVWNTSPNQTTASVSNLCVGQFIVTVRDSNLCTVYDTVTITQPTPIVLVTTQVNVTCNGANDGTATVTASGGNGSYTYSWSSGTPTGVGNTVTGLTPGTATVTVHDVNGCSATASVTITEPALLVATATGTNVLCYGGNTGRASVTQTGGTPDGNGLYHYTWSGGVQIGNGDTVVNLIAGTYYVTVTDAHGCFDSASVVITQPLAPLSDTITTSNVRCHGGNDGGARAHVAGGTSPYTEIWSSGFPVGTGDSVGGLSAGTYFVTITDANGCSVVDHFTITEPNELVLTIHVDSNTNCTSNTGGLTVSLVGGTTPYSYVWNTTPVQSTNASPLTYNSAINLGVGNYTVIVTDSQGCSKQISASIVLKPKPVVDSVVSTPTTCSTNNGQIDIYAHTANPPLSFTWNPNVSSGASAAALSPGTYSVTVADATGCDTVISVVVTTISKLHVDTTIVKDAYCGHKDGLIHLFVSQGTLPYTYSWSDANLNSNLADSLAPGAYIVTITDANGCDTILSFNILDIVKPVISIMPDTAVKIHKGQSVDVLVTLVSSPDSVSYAWTPTSGLSCDSCATPTAKPDQTTTYMVVATDTVTGCYDSTFITVIVKDADNLFVPNAITPNGDGVNDIWMLRELYYCPENEVVILNRWGDEVFRAKPYNNDWGGTYNGKLLPAGTYYYILKLDCTGETLTGPITVIR